MPSTATCFYGGSSLWGVLTGGDGRAEVAQLAFRSEQHIDLYIKGARNG